MPTPEALECKVDETFPTLATNLGLNVVNRTMAQGSGKPFHVMTSGKYPPGVQTQKKT